MYKDCAGNRHYRSSACLKTWTGRKCILFRRDIYEKTFLGINWLSRFPWSLSWDGRSPELPLRSTLPFYVLLTNNWIFPYTKWNLYIWGQMDISQWEQTDTFDLFYFNLSTAVEQVVACALVTQRARVRSPVGTSFLGEVFRGFSSPVRQMSRSFRPTRSPNIIWPS